MSSDTRIVEYIHKAFLIKVKAYKKLRLVLVKVKFLQGSMYFI